MGLYTIEKPGQGMRVRVGALLLLLVLFGWGSVECHNVLYEYFGLHYELPDPNVDTSEIRFTPFEDSRTSYAISRHDGTLVRYADARQESGGIPVRYRIVQLVDGQSVVLAEGEPGQRPDQLYMVERPGTREPAPVDPQDGPAEADPEQDDPTPADNGNGNDEPQENGNGNDNDEHGSLPSEFDPMHAHPVGNGEGDAENGEGDAENGEPQTQPGADANGDTEENGEPSEAENGEAADDDDDVIAREPDAMPRDDEVPVGRQRFPYEDFLDRDYLISHNDQGVYVEFFNPEIEYTPRSATNEANWLGAHPVRHRTLLAEGQWWDPVHERQVNGTGFPVSALLALGMFLIIFTIAWRMTMGRWGGGFLVETEQELNRVHWPTRQRVFHSSIIVILVVLVVGILLFFADVLLNAVISALQLW